MRRRFTCSIAVVVAITGALALSRPIVSAQTKATATNVPVIPHEAVPNFFKNPAGIYTGENMGISTDSKGNIYTTETYTGKRLQKFSFKGIGPVTSKKQGPPWPKAGN